MNYKENCRKQSWPNFKVLSQHLPGGTEEITEDLYQDIRSPGQYLNSGTP
jgi:hypothetical protein